MLDLNNLQNYRKNSRIEANQALGGLPESIWEPYSAFCRRGEGDFRCTQEGIQRRMQEREKNYG